MKIYLSELKHSTANNYREEEEEVISPMLDILPLWLYCCLTLARLAAVASMAEFDLPGVE